MAEQSYFWGGLSIGDAVIAPYDNDEFTDIWRKLFQRDRATQGVIESFLNGLVVTNPSGNTIRVATGAALVDGKFYENDANVDNVIATPGVATRVDRVVLRKSWASQTVRVTIITGVEGAGIPAIVQVDGATWDLPLAQVSITTGAVITVTNESVFVRSPLAPKVSGSLVEIETIVGDSIITSIDFQNIPNIYKHLLVIGTVRMDGAILQGVLEARFNNDSGANYNEQEIRGDNTTPAAAGTASGNEIKVGEVPCGTAITDHVGHIQAHIPNYKEATFFKTIMAQYGNIPDNTVGNFTVGIAGGIWRDTSAISRLALLSTTASAGTFTNETRVTLYGIL